MDQTTKHIFILYLIMLVATLDTVYNYFSGGAMNLFLLALVFFSTGIGLKAIDHLRDQTDPETTG